jgi:hypothetical protein
VQRTVVSDPKAPLRLVDGNVESFAGAVLSRRTIAAAATSLDASRRGQLERQDQNLELI